jgi:2-dehydro-3-deoxy-D-arabinonate dehydratase
MKLCRFQPTPHNTRVGLTLDGETIIDLSSAGYARLTPLLEDEDTARKLGELAQQKLMTYRVADVRLLPPVERQEVWAAGVTYLRSKKARMEESDFSASAYDLVYEAERPEIFFKSLPDKAAGPGDHVGIRRDASWNVPEPELALVINSRQKIVGYTIGNDMSSRDIEGANLLYLPQAKVYDKSCALGPWITVGIGEDEARQWTIQLEIKRGGETVFVGETSVGQIKRSFNELVGFLCRSQTFLHGAVLLTGTGIVPGDDFTLRSQDIVRITISGVGTLENSVVTV